MQLKKKYHTLFQVTSPVMACITLSTLAMLVWSIYFPSFSNQQLHFFFKTTCTYPFLFFHLIKKIVRNGSLSNVGWTWTLSFPVLSRTLHFGLFEISYSQAFLHLASCTDITPFLFCLFLWQDFPKYHLLFIFSVFLSN